MAVPTLVYPLINGVRYDHSSHDIKIVGVSMLGVKALDYSDSLEPGKVYGTSAQKLARTRGQYDAEGSLELFFAEALVFEGQLVQQNPNTGLYECVFGIDVTLVPEGGLPAFTDNLVGCRIKKASDSTSSGGSDAKSRKYDLDLMYIIKNGVIPITGLRR